MKRFLATFRAITTGIWRNSPRATTGRRPPSTRSSRTRRRATSRWPSCRRRTPSVSVSRSTSASSTTRYWTARTGRAGWRRPLSTTPSPNSTRYRRRATRTARWSCSCWGTISPCGPVICRVMVSFFFLFCVFLTLFFAFKFYCVKTKGEYCSYHTSA